MVRLVLVQHGHLLSLGLVQHLARLGSVRCVRLGRGGLELVVVLVGAVLLELASHVGLGLVVDRALGELLAGLVLSGLVGHLWWGARLQKSYVD